MYIRIFLSFGLILISFISCTDKRHARLISFNSRFLRDLTENERNTISEGDPIDYKISKEQKADTLFITVDFPWSGCAKFNGDIDFKRDSLNLFYFLTNETLCTEIIYYRLNYKVLNRDKKEYSVSVQNKSK